MKGSEIREKFLRFFESKLHKRIESSSLIPQGDKTLLFTNAGMVQFKSVFTGEETRPYKRATSSQKCVRAGGKHNDLENVGVTARHHTFFEMLGNFSFGDYFKKEAIIWAWEFLVDVCKLPVDRLWVTIYKDDDEAFEIWKKEIGISEDRIIRMGDSDNFWSMGDTGPCGPCSEIIYDQGEGIGCGREECDIYCDCDRFLEIWNLVFMQYERREDGTMAPLPKPSIDTGMGLERITAVIQGKNSNYDTDLIFPIIDRISRDAKIKYGHNERNDIACRVIADHIRAMTFLIADGVLPSNEGRGYVLRRILRRAKRYQEELGIDGEYLYTLVDVVMDIMLEAYPYLREKGDIIKKVIKLDEEKFEVTLRKGKQIVNDFIRKIKNSNKNVLNGEDVFKLYDTYGYPLELSKDIFEKHGITIDEKGFEACMLKQKEGAKFNKKQDDLLDKYDDIIEKVKKTEFLGYENMDCEAEIIFIDDNVVILNKTTFYAESGGQVGDKGIIRGDNFEIRVFDTKKKGDIYFHFYDFKKGKPKVGDRVFVSVDNQKRRFTMYNHSATHLLQAALREVLGEHVQQAGSLVNDERLRFDFKHFAALSDYEISQIEELVNIKIWSQLPVKIEIKGIEEAKKEGALAFFEEKYGQMVRIIRMGDFSLEFCGGTHVNNTGEIGLFKILNETGVAASVRRIEATTNINAWKLLKKKEELLKETKELLRLQKEEIIPKRVNDIINDLKNYEREVETLKLKLTGSKLDKYIENSKVIDDFKLVIVPLKGVKMNELRQLSDEILQKIKKGIVVLGSSFNNKAQLVVKVSKDLTDKLKAGDIIKKIAAEVGGSGGGRPDMAQAGGKEPKNLNKALNMTEEVIKRYYKVK